ncbi:MAG TPA: hypothetical protein GXX13_11360 [Acinetobacter towneri]|nr:hypothetical protein [Acinetobacter towneri]
MIDPRIPMMGQSPDMIEAVNSGFADGGNFAKLLIGSQVNRMRDIEDPTQRQAFANKNFFGRQLRAQLREDELAQAQALREQQKHDADIYNTLAQGGERIANAGKTTQETTVNRQRAMSSALAAAMRGDPRAANFMLEHGKTGGIIDDASYEQAKQFLTTNANNPEAISSLVESLGVTAAEKPEQYIQPDANTVANNITSRANNEATVGATLAGQQVQKEIADANRVSNDAYRMQQLHMQQNKGQIVNAADGKSYIYYPNLNKYEPMLDQSGQHVSKVGTVDKRKESERLQKMESILQQAEGLIGKSTSSGLGNMIDEGASFFGKSNEGADSLAALKSLQGSLVMMMPRMEGPQSDKDVQLYREMAGRLGEPIPASQRMEAIKVIRDLNAKYAEIQGVDSGVAPKGVPYASAGQATTSYNGANVSLSEVKQAAKQAGISTEQMVSILKGQGVSIK